MNYRFKVLHPLSMEEKVHNFCLRWLSVMDGNYDRLISEYREANWDHDEFTTMAKQRNWYVKSMDCLP